MFLPVQEPEVKIQCVLPSFFIFQYIIIVIITIGDAHVCRSEDSFHESVLSSCLSADSTISPPSCNKGLQSKPSPLWSLYFYVLRQGFSSPEGLTIPAGLNPLTFPLPSAGVGGRYTPPCWALHGGWGLELRSFAHVFYSASHLSSPSFLPSFPFTF